MTAAKLFFALCCTRVSASVAHEDPENCAALPANKTQGVEERAMLQHSKLRHMAASLHTQMGKQPPGYTVVGSGQCTDEDGTEASMGWAPCTCDLPTGSQCAAGTCASADVCASDCDTEPGCAAFAFTAGHCWLYSGMSKPYVKASDAFQWYSCYVKAPEPMITTSTTTTAVPCVPYSQDACVEAALNANLGMGTRSYSFAGNYPTKGCYFYSYGSSDYGGVAFYGLGGSEAENMEANLGDSKYRIPGYDCQTSYAPSSMESCLQATLLQGLYVGGKGYEFASSSHSTKGCYMYSSGSYYGYSYYGLGGTPSENDMVPAAPQTRPGGYAGGCIPYSKATCQKAAAALGLGWSNSQGGGVIGCVGLHLNDGTWAGAYRLSTYDGNSKDNSAIQKPYWRPRLPGYDCNSACEPYSKFACLQYALLKGAPMGDKSRSFEVAFPTAPAGCWTWAEPSPDAGNIYYNTQGGTPTLEAKQAPVESQFVRIVADCSPTP